MAKLKDVPITQNDLALFLDGTSDFAFEIQVLNFLHNEGFTCEHGGEYVDPVTEKLRQFDIRAMKGFGRRILRLAVECKNLRENYPLLISCVPRRTEESFHEILLSYLIDSETTNAIGIRDALRLPTSQNLRLTGSMTIYQTGDPVGKATDQVGYVDSKDKLVFVRDDAGVFDKWSQALSSANELTRLAMSDGKTIAQKHALTLVFPIVVVPDERLWVTEYDSTGARKVDPKKVNRCSYYVGRTYDYDMVTRHEDFVISHIEFVTVTGLREFIAMLCGSPSRVENSFPLLAVPEQKHRNMIVE